MTSNNNTIRKSKPPIKMRTQKNYSTNIKKAILKQQSNLRNVTERKKKSDFINFRYLLSFLAFHLHSFTKEKTE